MGKLSITGKAEREVSYNAVEMSVTFYIHAKTTAEALQIVMEQSEKFLELVTAAGVDMKDIHIGDNSVDQRYSDDELKVHASREMKIRLRFDIAFVNGLMDMIREQDFAVDLDCDYHLTNRAELHMELMKEALADSKKKAEVIAEIMGQKIIGIDSVEHDRHSDMEWMCCEQERGIICAGAAPLSNQLEAPITTESETISVVWLIE